MRISIRPWTLSLPLWLLSVAAPLAVPEREDFLRGLAIAEKRLEQGQVKSAARELEELLGEHRDEAYVIVELDRVRRILARGRFEREVPVPEREALLRGEVVERLTAKDEVRLRLRFEDGVVDGGAPLAGLAHAPGDLEWSAERWWFPVPYAGPGRLLLRGRVPAEFAAEGERPRETLFAKLSVGHAEGEFTTFEVAVGALGEGAEASSPVRVLSERKGSAPKLHGESNERPLAPGEAYELELRVTKRRLFLRSGGETLLHVRRPAGAYGRFGWVDLPGLEELELEGELDGAWLDRLPERHRSAAFAAWLAVGPKDLGMPVWIEEWVATKPPPIRSARHLETYDAIVGCINDERYADAHERLAAAGMTTGSSWHADWYLSVIHRRTGDMQAALAHLELVLERTPRFERAVEAREQILGSLGYRRLSELYRDGDYAAGLEWLATTEGEAVDAWARHWYAYLFHEGLGDWRAARAATERVLELRPDDVRAIRGHALLAWRLGERGAALKGLRRIAATDARARLELARLAVRLGRAEEALALAAEAEGAEDRRAWSELVEQAERSLREPSFEDARRYPGRDCVVVSRLFEDHCRAAVETFDDTRVLVERLVGEIPKERDVHEPIRCFLFHSPDAYRRYQREVLEHPSEQVLGVHSAELWQVIVEWRLARRSLATVRHEAVHNYLTRRFGSVPVWFHEGVACYLQWARDEDGETRFEAERFDRLERLKRDGAEWASFRDWTGEGSDAFYTSEPGRNYAQALALIAYLLDGDAPPEAWSRLLEDLEHGRGARALEHLLERVPDLDERVRRFVRD